MARQSLRTQIVDAGLSVMFRSGYAGSGIREIMGEASAPQGSFTNHFRSKEAFAGEVLDEYFDYVKGHVRHALEDRTLSPRGRLRRYLDIITERLGSHDYAFGCLIGNFSLEASSQSEALRARLAAIFLEWRAPFAACIAEGQAAGEIASTFDPDDLADFFLASWQGAILRMKVERSSAALERFKTIMFQTVFQDQK